MRLSSVVIRMRFAIHACDAHGPYGVQISLTAFRCDVNTVPDAATRCLINRISKRDLHHLCAVVMPTYKYTYNNMSNVNDIYGTESENPFSRCPIYYSGYRRYYSLLHRTCLLIMYYPFSALMKHSSASILILRDKYRMMHFNGIRIMIMDIDVNR